MRGRFGYFFTLRHPNWYFFALTLTVLVTHAALLFASLSPLKSTPSVLQTPVLVAALRTRSLTHIGTASASSSGEVGTPKPDQITPPPIAIFTPSPKRKLPQPAEVSKTIMESAQEAPVAASATASNWIETSSMRYRQRDELDSAAEPLADLGLEFAKIFPVLSGTVVVEFWISETGSVTRVDILQGTTLSPIDTALIEMLRYEFVPALVANAPVASRKLVEINTNNVP